jgi:hypothetical protein
VGCEREANKCGWIANSVIHGPVRLMMKAARLDSS